MCYSALIKRDLKNLELRFGAIAVREQIDYFLKYSDADPKKFPPIANRIFPGSYAPIVSEQSGKRIIRVMKYGLTPPSFITDPKKFTSYNARRDNLQSKFWSEAFLIGHGLIGIDAFYEWVAVKDLLAAGAVSLAQVRDTFAKQAEERRLKIESSGKRYRPTPTELKDARFRKIIIEFKPSSTLELTAPVIFVRKEIDGYHELSFAIVTDDPLPEIAEAGHDRCPIFLTPEAADEWLHAERLSAPLAIELLGQKLDLRFVHSLPRTA